jgi:hypothetical protein
MSANSILNKLNRFLLTEIVMMYVSSPLVKIIAVNRSQPPPSKFLTFHTTLDDSFVDILRGVHPLRLCAKHT